MAPTDKRLMRALKRLDDRLVLDRDAREPASEPGEGAVTPTKIALSPDDLAASGEPGVIMGRDFVGTLIKASVPEDASSALRSRAALQGKRVVVTPTISCGHCDMCRSGLPRHCRTRSVLGLHGRDGAAADLLCVPLLNTHPVPDDLDDDHAAFAPLVARALHAAQLGRVDTPSYVTIIGDGALPLLAAQVLTRLNTSVRLLTDSPRCADLCDRWGVKHRPTADVGRRQDQDAIIVASPSSAHLRLALQLVRPRGGIVLMPETPPGPFAPGKPFPDAPAHWSAGCDLDPLIANEVRLLGAREGSLPDALSMMQRGQIDVIPLITARLMLDDVPEEAAALVKGDHLRVMIEV